jgi:hypothetical protein
VFAGAEDFDVRDIQLTAFLREYICAAYVYVVVAASCDDWFVHGFELFSFFCNSGNCALCIYSLFFVADNFCKFGVSQTG